MRTTISLITVTLLLAAATGAFSADSGGAARPATLTAQAATALRQSADASQAWRPARVSLAPARWIWLPSERTPACTFVLFRKEVALEQAPAQALGWITADSRYRLTVNGRRVQWGPAPCDPRELDVDPIDLGPYLKAGKNVIGVEVLFYGHGDGTWPGGKPGMIFNLEIKDAHGEAKTIVSDASWQARLDRAHPVGQAKRWYLRALQEEFDARLHPYGWDTPEQAPDAEWMPARELNCAPDKPAACQADRLWTLDSVDRVDPAVASLRLRQIPMPREAETPAWRLAESGRVAWKRAQDDWFQLRIPDAFEIKREAVAQEAAGGMTLPATPEASQGVFATYEFKEQVVGFPYFTIEAPAGTVIELMTQEAHNPAKTAWLDSHFFAWSRFVCREGINRFEAFDFESLRWMQLHVHGATRPVTIKEVGVRRRTFPWASAPRVRTSEAGLQKLVDATLNTLSNSCIETIVDGMGRERQQYSGDAGHQLHAIRYVFGEERICARYLRTFSQGLSVDGYFLDCWPAYDRLARIGQKEVQGAFWGPLLDHGVGFNFDCWNHYLESGDLEAVREPYPRLQRFAEYLESKLNKDGLLEVENLGIPTVWIDHNAYKKPAHKQCPFNLYVAAMFTHALAPLAEAMHDQEHAAHYREMGGKILAATVRRFWSPERKMFVDNLPWLKDGETPRLSDRTLAMAILFDQCPGGEIAAAREALVNCPPEMGFSYPCNAGWRLWALAKCRRIDVALKDLRTRWTAMESVGRNNTLQEDWHARPDSVNQWSHSALAPLYILFQEVAGIRPLAPGFARVRIQPQPGDLPDLELATPTPRGVIEFKSRRQGGGQQVSVKIPEGMEGELALPAGSRGEGLKLEAAPGTALARAALMPGKESSFFIPDAAK